MQTWIHVLEWRATTDAAAPAVADDRRALTYAELHAAVEERAGGWHTRGIGVDDVVAIVAHNSVELLVQSLALQRIGALPLLLNWRLTAPEVARLLEVARPVGVFADRASAPLVGDVHGLVAVVDGLDGTDGLDGWVPLVELTGPVAPRPVERLASASTAFLMHTSGTTGRPKVIPVEHGALIRSLSGFALDIGDQVRGSRHLVMMPLFHLAGYAQAMQAFLTGGSLVLHDGVVVDRVLTTIERERIEFFTAAPTIIEMLVEAVETTHRGADLSSLKEIQYGAAPIAPELLTRAVALICPRFRQIYGSTELQGFLTNLRPEDHVAGTPALATAGQVVQGWEARVVDADGSALPTGATGELQVRGEGVVRAYWRDPEATAEAWTDDGWYRTGDLAVIDDRQFVRIAGRAKDMIISGGENIYPAEVEHVLTEHPAVLEAAVVGRPDERWGERPVAYVVLTEEATATATVDDLERHCRAHLAGFKCPAAFTIVPTLPRNALGKVLKTDLRDRAATEA